VDLRRPCVCSLRLTAGANEEPHRGFVWGDLGGVRAFGALGRQRPNTIHRRLVPRPKGTQKRTPPGGYPGGVKWSCTHLTSSSGGGSNKPRRRVFGAWTFQSGDWLSRRRQLQSRNSNSIQLGTQTAESVRGLMPLSGSDERPLLKSGGHLSEHRSPRCDFTRS
jgi:hypothetical protein